MSEAPRLGSANAVVSWAGLARHRVLLALAGVGVVGDALLRPGTPGWEVAAGVALLVGALPADDARSVAQWTVAAASYLTRSRWIAVAVEHVANAAGERAGVSVTSARATAVVRGFELEHRGRLDLSGEGASLVRALGNLVDSLALAPPDQHVSWHVRRDGDELVTLLAVRGAGAAPATFRPRDALIAWFVGAVVAERTWLLERWCYLRAPYEVVRVLRIRDFTAARDAAVLDRLAWTPSRVGITVHVAIVESTRARHLTERAVHRSRSDAAISRGAGFRESARSASDAGRLAQREVQVAAGRALVRLGVYVTVHAAGLDELRASVAEVLEVAHAA
ncbi:MAG: hypothetical protein ACP5PB_07785, partial [Acidimicrobiales bacterium]